MLALPLTALALSGLILATPSPARRQLETGHTIVDRTTGLCLAVRLGSDRRLGKIWNGTSLLLEDCASSPKEAFNWIVEQGPAQIRLANTDFCLDAGIGPYVGPAYTGPSGPDFGPSGKMDVVPTNNLTMNVSFAPPPPFRSRSSRIFYAADSLLSLPQIWQCHDHVGSTWTFTDDGHLAVAASAQCLDWYPTSSTYEQVQSFQCTDGAPGQAWSIGEAVVDPAEPPVVLTLVNQVPPAASATSE
jgi:hypothetical protein